jgi:hypothetical protein
MKSILTAALLLSASLLHADVPALINYQGLLTDINGNVVSGSKTVSISIHDAATNGTQLYSESIGSVTVQNGIYSFQFGNGPTFTTTLATGSQHWLQVTIDAVAQTPRERLVSVPFAMKAQDAVTAGFNAAAEARVRTLEDNFLLSRVDDFAYRGLVMPSIPVNFVWESFPVAAGTNSRVTAATSGSFANDKYSAQGISIQDLPPVTLFVPNGQSRLFKTLSINAKTSRVEAEFSSGSTWAEFIFRYTDNTSEVAFGYGAVGVRSVNNPKPQKSVTTIEVYSGTNSNGTSPTVSNAKAVTLSPVTVTVSLSPQPSNWTSFRVSLLGAREVGDAVSFAITDGSTTISNLPLDTLHTWTGTSAPTSLTLSLTPGANASIGGTTANTVGVFFNP